MFLLLFKVKKQSQSEDVASNQKVASKKEAEDDGESLVHLQSKNLYFYNYK